MLKKIGCIAVMVLAVTGCNSESAAFNKKLNAYLDGSPKVSSHDVVLAYSEYQSYAYRTNLFESSTSRDRRLTNMLNDTEQAEALLLSAHKWDVLGALYEAKVPMSAGAGEYLLSNYQGDNPQIIKNIGEVAYHKGELFESYRFFERAALSDSRFAKYPKGMAFHYGCSDLNAIWGELTTDHEHFNGEAFPASELKMPRKELMAARINLRKGIAPVVPDDCLLKPQ